MDAILDVVAVSKAIDTDLRGGEFKNVAAFVLDNMTHVFKKATGVAQVMAQSGQSNSGASSKAAQMNVLRTILASVQMDAAKYARVSE
ncbi:MAG TPA: hypothetical protein PKH10_09965, partial [bacterium]|nr:hypothetical protein [bacterium]